jgi:hypothetical protein
LFTKAGFGFAFSDKTVMFVDVVHTEQRLNAG